MNKSADQNNKIKLLLTKQSITKTSLSPEGCPIQTTHPTTEHKSNPTQVAEKIMSLSHFGAFLAHCIALTSAKVSVKRKLSFEIVEIRAAAISDHGW